MSATMDSETSARSQERDAASDAAMPIGPRASRRWPWALGAIAVVAGAVAVISLNGSDDAGDLPARETLNFAEAVQTDLVEVESYDATLGTVAGDPIKTQLGGTVTAAIAAGQTAVAGDVVYRVDGHPVVLLYGETPAYRDLAPTEDTKSLVNRRNGTVTGVVEDGTLLEQGDVAYFVDGEPVVVLYGDTPVYRAMRDASTNLEGDDILQLEIALVDLGYDDIGISVDGEFTNATESVVVNWQEAIGADDDGVVDIGEVIFIDGPATVIESQIAVGDTVTDGRSVLTLTGDTAMTGDDVLQLEQHLAASGSTADGDLSVDGVFDAATTAAILAWQAAAGLEVDGIVDLGEIVFVPGAVRVSEQLATPGTAVNPGSGVLAVSSADKVVTLDLPAEDQDLLDVGDAVVVELPDGTDVSATVTEVASVATVNQQGGAVFEITIVLDDGDAAIGLDEAPVDVEVVVDSVEDVLAVPVTALVALAEGGYAVEVEVAGGGTRLVAVDPGFFAGGLVEVRADSLSPGDRVVVP